ncbi:hypothetical protein [cf. Phormidesmis sp. LEGE 11477]|uniref:hypothetical protein n=1 Tax=cf. Phormidesmis sp. LEGE 11477 TaxID=1828680 RepID=UPI00187F2925|nr:hypothetical protein [cf. Phormidesmis sp. LEGE 11477]MBE9063396.1 hypothetical protein [cf. Phormidesmis sp. LEGE 11477]
MADPVLSQLVNVESDLSEQIEHLEAQLAQLQIKRQELLSVIDMFNNDQVNGNSDQPTSTQIKISDSEKALAKSKPAATAKSDRQTKQTGRSTKKKKKDGRAATWQKYVQSQYRSLALPEAVSSVLRSKPTEVFKIVDVMSSIFKESMPKTSYLKARNRISNILSAGARDGTWYRGRNGRYSQSESVTKS